MQTVVRLLVWALLVYWIAAPFRVAPSGALALVLCGLVVLSLFYASWVTALLLALLVARLYGRALGEDARRVRATFSTLTAPQSTRLQEFRPDETARPNGFHFEREFVQQYTPSEDPASWVGVGLGSLRFPTSVFREREGGSLV